MLLLHAAGLSRFAANLVGASTTFTTLAWFAAYACAIALLVSGRGEGWVGWFLRIQRLLATVLVIAAMSVLWSVAPDVTARRLVHLVGSTLIGLALGYCVPGRVLLHAVSVAFSMLVIGGIGAAVFLPEHGQQFYEGKMVWKGLQADKNIFGFTAVVTLLFFGIRCLFVGFPLLSLHWFAIPASFFVLIWSNSATSLLALLVGTVTILTFLIPTALSLRRNIGVAVLLVFILGAILGLYNNGIDAFTSVAGRSSDFTGRSELWEGVWNITKQRPWVGYGYGSLWFPADEISGLNQQELLGTSWPAAHAHNGFLHVAAEMGIPAAIIACLFLVLGLLQTVRIYVRSPSPFVLLIVGVQAAFLVGNIFEARLFVDRGFEWILLIMFSVALQRSLPTSMLTKSGDYSQSRGMSRKAAYPQ